MKTSSYVSKTLPSVSVVDLNLTSGVYRGVLGVGLSHFFCIVYPRDLFSSFKGSHGPSFNNRRALSPISSDRAESSCREFMMLTVEILE